MILAVLLFYPGLATRIFTVFRCKEIVGISGFVLEADFAVSCYESEPEKNIFFVDWIEFLSKQLDPPVTPFIPTTHGAAALKTPRTKATAAEIGARAPKDEDDRWEKWVFEDVALEDGEFFAGKILRLETKS